MAKKHKPSTSAFPPALFPYIRQASDDTLRRISRFDYGMEAERHIAALKQIVREQNGYVSADLGQTFYPGDVIELAAFDVQDAFGYTVCNLPFQPFTLLATLPQRRTEHPAAHHAGAARCRLPISRRTRPYRPRLVRAT